MVVCIVGDCYCPSMQLLGIKCLFKGTVQIFFLFSNSWLCTIDDRDATGTGSGTPLAVQYVTAVQSKQKVYRE